MREKSIAVLVFGQRREKSSGWRDALPPAALYVHQADEIKNALENQSFDLFLCLPEQEDKPLRDFLKEFSRNYPTVFFALIAPRTGGWENIPCDFRIGQEELESPTIWETCVENMVRLAEIRKRNFNLSAMLLHDIRSPIQSLIGYLELLQSEIFGELNDGQQQLISKAMSLSDLLSDLVDELGLVYQYEKHRIELNRTFIQPKKIVAQILRSMWILTDQKNIKLILQLSDRLPSVYADSLALHRILANLLLNAIKFTPIDGSIRISVHRTHGPDSSDMLEFRIDDSGPGIPEKQLSQIFDKYYRLADTEHRQKGQGLGLYICRMLVEAHGGKIGAHNNREGGATFYFTLPVAKEKQRDQ